MDSTEIRWESEVLCVSAIKKLHAQWESLTDQAIEKNIFLFPWFISASLPLLENKNPQITTIYSDDMLIGLFIVAKDVGYVKLPLRFYRTALHPDQFLATPLVREGFSDQFAIGLCKWLDTSSRDISMKLFPLLSADSPIHASLKRICQFQDRPLITIDTFSRAAIIPRAHSEEMVLDAIGKSRRKNLRRTAKKLSELGTVKIERMQDTDNIDEWIDEFLQLEHSGWKGKNQSSFLARSEDTEFFVNLAHSAFANNAMNFFRLTLDGRAIAYTFDLLGKPYGYGTKSAYDEAYRAYTPGILLIYESLKYYLTREEFDIIDSCTAPDNMMLNDLWPDRREITSLALLRSGKRYQWPFFLLYKAKMWLKERKLQLHVPKLKRLLNS